MMLRGLAICACLVFATALSAQETREIEADITATDQTVDVDAEPNDVRISRRIKDILDATEWFENAQVRVDDGIVFLDGTTKTPERKSWARDLAAKTTGVIAVVNRIEVETEVELTLDPAVREVRELKDHLLAALPSVVLAIVILPLAWFIAGLVRKIARRLLLKRARTPFVADLIARFIALPVLLVGIYIVLQVSGLTQLAVSVVGGAGVLGIVIGFAFRDIVENFLASLLLSIRQPFSRGDFIHVAGQQGLVHSMNTRSTVLVSPEGNHIQIPNATVFKSIIENLTAVPRRRGVIEIGIGYDAAISDVQKIVGRVLAEQKGVLQDPEPMVLADALGASTVVVNVYYWFDGAEVSPLKLKSELVRRIKQALTDAGISMPDEAREIIFPEGVPLISPEDAPKPEGPRKKREPVEAETDADLSSEDDLLAEQMTTEIEGGLDDNLLSPAPADEK